MWPSSRNSRFKVLLHQIVALAGLGAASSSALAIGCAELSGSIDARMRANGLSNFSLAVVDTAVLSPGKVVGTCDLGARKILYIVEPGAAGRGVITECDDGRKVTNGPCKP